VEFLIVTVDDSLILLRPSGTGTRWLGQCSGLKLPWNWKRRRPELGYWTEGWRRVSKGCCRRVLGTWPNAG